MATMKLGDEALLAILHSHPDLRDRIASIALAVENSEGDLKEADAAEGRIVEELPLLEREAMQGWAERQDEATERKVVNRRVGLASGKSAATNSTHHHGFQGLPGGGRSPRKPVSAETPC